MDSFLPIDRADADPLSFAVAERDRDVRALVDEALTENRVQLAYQPVVLAGATDRLAFYEGLIRILDATGRAIPAKEFIADVENTEIGRRIDCAALEFGLAALAENPTLRLSVNMSARSIGYSGWLRTLDRGIGYDPDVAARLIVEITESSIFAAPETVAAFMTELQGLGVCFAMDDFGAGYTSLRHLRDLDFDILKIDGTFVHGIHANPDNKVLASALLAVGQHFGMLTVAENVERAADADWLAQAGVDCLQGYYFGAPTLRPDWTNAANLGAAG